MSNTASTVVGILMIWTLSLSFGSEKRIPMPDGKLDDVSLCSAGEIARTKEICADVCMLLKGQSLDMQTNVVKSLSNSFRQMAFDESSYESRVRSFDAYFGLVNSTTERLRENIEDPASVFLFKFEALNRINIEIDKCMKEPKGGPYGNLRSGGGMGFSAARMIQRRYLDRLKRKRYDTVRDGFELDRGFCEFFYSLSVLEQMVWKGRLEKMACRNVVVYDRNHPFEMPPLYVPEDSREWLPTKPGEPRRYIEYIGGGSVAIGQPVVIPKNYGECLDLVHDAVDVGKRTGFHFFGKSSYVWGICSDWKDKEERRRLVVDFVKALGRVELTNLSTKGKRDMMHYFWLIHVCASEKLVGGFGENKLAEELILNGFSEYRRMCFSFGDENDISDGDGVEARERRQMARTFRETWEKDVDDFMKNHIDSIFPKEKGGVSESFMKKWSELTKR